MLSIFESLKDYIACNPKIMTDTSLLLSFIIGLLELFLIGNGYLNTTK